MKLPHSASATFATYKWNELEQLPVVDAMLHLADKAHDTKNTTAEQAWFDINVGSSIG